MYNNRNAPKYNVVPFGYERINEHFFYYKSLMNRIGWDNALIDAVYENTMNRDILDLFTPISVSGVENVDTAILMPGSVTVFENPEAEARPIIPPNRVAGYQALREIEKSRAIMTISTITAAPRTDAIFFINFPTFIFNREF